MLVTNRFLITRAIPMLAFMILLSGGLSSQPSDKSLQIGKKAPTISCEGMEGNCISLDELAGKVVLVEFWSSSNHSSMIDHVELEKLYTEYKDANFKNGHGFEVMSIALDDSPERWKFATIRDNNSWPYSMYNTDKWNAQAALDYNIQTIPKYFLIDGDGEVIENLFLMKDLHTILAKYSSKAR